MNTYAVSYQGPFATKHVQIQASNIHTTVKNVLAYSGGRTKGGRLKPVSIRKGQSLTIRVTRIS